VKLLLDTHLLIWVAAGSHRLSNAAKRMIEDESNTLLFSALSIWEVAIKYSLSRGNIEADPRELHRELLDADYVELPITGEHGRAVANLPFLHKDPFDRLLIAQAMVEDATLLTADTQLAKYPGPIRKV
jgi:PIN domain nuclease of toxin-antitoxin system